MLAGRTIVLGVSGGIAAYKAPELVRRLQDAGALVIDVQEVLQVGKRVGRADLVHQGGRGDVCGAAGSAAYRSSARHMTPLGKPVVPLV